MNSEVNIKYVLGLEEQAGKTLQIVKIDIPQSSDITEELEAMQENPNKNLYDMSSYFTTMLILLKIVIIIVYQRNIISPI